MGCRIANWVELTRSRAHVRIRPGTICWVSSPLSPLFNLSLFNLGTSGSTNLKKEKNDWQLSFKKKKKNVNTVCLKPHPLTAPVRISASEQHVCARPQHMPSHIVLQAPLTLQQGPTTYGLPRTHTYTHTQCSLTDVLLPRATGMSPPCYWDPQVHSSPLTAPGPLSCWWCFLVKCASCNSRCTACVNLICTPPLWFVMARIICITAD